MAQVTLSLVCFVTKLSTTETLLSIHQAMRPADASWLTFHILVQPHLSNSTTISISLTAGLLRQMMLSFGLQHQSDQELSHQKENLAPAKLLLVLVVLAIVALAVLVMAVLAAVATILPSFAMLVLPIVMQVIMLTAVTMVLPMAILVGPVITQAATETVVTMVLRTDILVVLAYTAVMVLLKTQLADDGTQLARPSPNGC